MSAAAATRRDVERLGKLLGRLGSDHPGERDNAAVLATKHLKAIGVTWAELAERAFAPAPRDPRPPSPRRAPRPRPRVDPQARAVWLLSTGRLSLWEVDFLSGIAERTRPLSPRQATKLDEIAERIERRTGGSAR